MNLDMIKKTRRNRSSIDSSSSEEMERLKQPKDVLGLGRHLVRELKLRDRGDTLAHWMAHHVADLIKAAKSEKSPGERRKATIEATETILKIWEHRESLPPHAYPLARYADLFKVLDGLQPSDNPFRFGQDVGTKTDRLAASLFEDLSFLIICLLLMKPLSLRTAETVDKTVLESLSEDERKVWEALQKWEQLVLPKSDPQEWNQSSEVPKYTHVDLTETALDLVKGIKNSVEELQVELEKYHAESSSAKCDDKARSEKRARKQRAKRK